MTQWREAKVAKVEIALPPSADGSSFAIHRAVSEGQVEISLPEGASPQDFFLVGANYQLPHAVLTRVRACAQRIRCRPETAAADLAPNMQVYLYIAGTSENVCEGRHTQLGPGDIVIYDSRRGYEAEVTAFDVRIVMVPHDRVPPIFLSPGVHGLRLPAETAGTRLLATAIESLLREVEDLTAAEADHAVLALCQLAAGIIETQLARAERAVRRGTESLLDAAMAYIEHRRTDPELGPEAVRAYVGVSRSTLYRLFAPLGGIEAVIRRHRLDHAMRALLTGSTPLPSPRRLAQSQGFRTETQFVRAFQARFGTTPAQVRNKVAGNDQAWLVAQAGRAGFGSLQAWLATLVSSSLEADRNATARQQST